MANWVRWPSPKYILISYLSRKKVDGDIIFKNKIRCFKKLVLCID